MPDEKSFGERVKDWWQRLKDLFASPSPARRQRSEPSVPSVATPNNPDQPRYQVNDQQGNQVSASDTLKEAHGQWQQLTAQQGQIVDTQTGQDVTPLPDDNGRYVVLDRDDQPVGSFEDADTALQFWRDVQLEKGRVIDTKTGQDITAGLKGYLTDAELQAAMQMVAAGGYSQHRGFMYLSVDPALIQRMMIELNRMELPIYDIANVAGSGSRPTKKVSITRRKVTIVTKSEEVWEDYVVKQPAAGRRIVPFPSDDFEPRRIRSVSELPRVRPSRLALPRPLLARRIVQRDLPMTEFYEDEPATEITRKRKVIKQVEVPEVEEWQEEIQVSDEARTQLLEIVVDISMSMAGENICLAIALAAVLIGKHLDDDSRYLYRQFASEMGEMRRAETRREKEGLITFITEQRGSDLGGGTDIKKAIDVAAGDVRHEVRSGDQPEIVLITDGGHSISSGEVYGAIREDVIMHTVNVGYAPNHSLRRSTTYVQLCWDWSSGKAEVSEDGSIGTPIDYSQSW